MARHGNQKAMANRRMAAARVLKGLTQRQLAQQVGTREIEISRVETGRLSPTEEMKRRIAEVLGKPAWEIFRPNSTAC